MSGWSVWKVYYLTYRQIAEQGDKPPELIAHGLSLEDAKRRADELGEGVSITDRGYGFCVKPL